MLFVPIFTLVPKLHPGLPESRFSLGTPEKNAKADPKVDVGSRSRSSTSIPTSPKPLLQSPKPSLAARPTIPQKPRTASRPGKGFAGQGVTPRLVAPQGGWVGDSTEGFQGSWNASSAGSIEGVVRNVPDAVEVTKARGFFYSALRHPTRRLPLHSGCKPQGAAGKAVLCCPDPFRVPR